MVRLCIRDLLPSLLKILELSKKDQKETVKANGQSNPMDKVKLASTGSNWKKLKVPIKSYLEDMLIVSQNSSLKKFILNCF